MKKEEVKLCVVCWRDSIASRAYHYLTTIPVCDNHYHCVCARCRRRWARWWVSSIEEYGCEIFACDECSETLDRLATRREAYNQYIQSDEWRKKVKNNLRTDMRRERGGVVCSRCGMSERDNKLTYGEGLHGHHLTYKRFGHEHSEDVQLLCSRCHAWEHRLPSPKPIRERFGIGRSAETT
jgi:hypothetical protein